MGISELLQQFVTSISSFLPSPFGDLIGQVFAALLGILGSIGL